MNIAYGQRVRLSEQGIRALGYASLRDHTVVTRLGTLANKRPGHSEDHVMVLWDGLKRPQRYYIGYIEPLEANK